MSLVGPRPHAIAHDDEFKARISNYALRHHVKPGLTGAAQVAGLRGETQRLSQMEQRVERDLWYIDNWSLDARSETDGDDLRGAATFRRLLAHQLVTRRMSGALSSRECDDLSQQRESALAFPAIRPTPATASALRRWRRADRSQRGVICMAEGGRACHSCRLDGAGKFALSAHLQRRKPPGARPPADSVQFRFEVSERGAEIMRQNDAEEGRSIAVIARKLRDERQ